MSAFVRELPIPVAEHPSIRETIGNTVLSVGVGDMHCAGCAAFIEDDLRKRPGVVRAHVHFATQRARIVFDSHWTSKKAIEAAIRELGYVTEAESVADQQSVERLSRRRHIWRFGLATLCAMQLMMVTVPRFLAGGDMEPDLASLLDWAALVLVLPVVAISALPFYLGAIRELRIRRPGMDSAIVLGVITAFVGSCWHIVKGSGTLYFDSVTMFVALLLGVRWLEWEQRQRNRARVRVALNAQSERLAHRVELPDQLTNPEAVALSALVVGDLVVVKTGETIPADCELLSDSTECDESMLTGESSLIVHRKGEQLFGGTVNCGPTVVMRVVATVDSSAEQRLLALADTSCKPASLQMGERVARWFMPLLLLTGMVTLIGTLPQGLGVAMERAIAVIIISCPCALALAAPAAYARSFAILLGRDIVVRRDGALERLAVADCFVLDKTGTLTEPRVESIADLRDGLSRQRCLTIAAALEQSANHPLADAIRASRETHDDLPVVENGRWLSGAGVEGVIDGVCYRFGRLTYAVTSADQHKTGSAERQASSLWLSDPEGIMCSVTMGESLKEDAQALVDLLKHRGQVEICSGDANQKVEQIACELSLKHWSAEVLPSHKAARVQALQREGRIVVMIGDGVNDSLGFAGADVAIATGGATDIARASADFVCTGSRLRSIIDCVQCASTTHLIIKSNFAWAVGYNIVAIPCAIAGLVNPLVAGIGMAASSAFVLLNVFRIRDRDWQ